MIVVTFALPAESADFARLLGNRDAVSIFHTGVGRKVAAERVRSALEQPPRPTIVISGGFAGALSDQLAVGELLLAENFSDAEPLAAAKRALAQTPHRIGKLATADSVLDSADERRQLAQTSEAVAVDMETEAIRDACRAAGLPMLSTRVITDTPAMPFPAPPSVLFDVERQRTDFVRLAGHVLRRPGAAFALLAFAKRIAACRQTLACALELVVRARER